MAQYTMLDLLPVGHSFNHPDGSVYPVLTATQFSTVQLQQLAELEVELPKVLSAFQTASAGNMAQVVTRMDQVVNIFFALLCPEMPEEKRNAISIQQKVNFVTWWQTEETKLRALSGGRQGEARAGKQSNRTRRGRSPASSTPVTTRAKS